MNKTEPSDSASDSKNDSCSNSLLALVGKVSDSVRQKTVPAITKHLKKNLEEMIKAGDLELPEICNKVNGDCYARRLLHFDEKLGFSIVAMTWGPGQKTPLHDHGGIWCVECVVKGKVSVTQYEKVEEKQGHFKFSEKAKIKAGVGEAGALIPPFEYHVMGNALKNGPSISLHVYGNDIKTCNMFTPEADGWYKRTERQLTYCD